MPEKPSTRSEETQDALEVILAPQIESLGESIEIVKGERARLRAEFEEEDRRLEARLEELSERRRHLLN